MFLNGAGSARLAPIAVLPKPAHLHTRSSLAGPVDRSGARSVFSLAPTCNGAQARRRNYAGPSALLGPQQQLPVRAILPARSLAASPSQAARPLLEDSLGEKTKAARHTFDFSHVTSIRLDIRACTPKTSCQLRALMVPVCRNAEK
ncbi:hypothetical protein HPB48_009990 [Haemaphysalis longicornis]|uniref:Uncharacterized protein n=1 Tax=Haemaphysalis longicornis TaxID=44386 RepID=A0A9J6FXS4_HAELO|nr:hypothetical protein HPB48_009990 [Haemaphysalis longicornis]